MRTAVHSATGLLRVAHALTGAARGIGDKGIAEQQGGRASRLHTRTHPPATPRHKRILDERCWPALLEGLHAGDMAHVLHEDEHERGLRAQARVVGGPALEEAARALAREDVSRAQPAGWRTWRRCSTCAF